MLINVEKDSTETILNVGDNLVVNASFYEINKPLNPYTFNYKKYLVENKLTSNSRLNEDKQELLDFIKANSKEIAQAVRATNLKNISSDIMGDISATPLFIDYEMVSSTSAPKATIELNGETFTIQDVVSNPSMFLNKKVVHL